MIYSPKWMELKKYLYTMNPPLRAKQTPPKMNHSAAIQMRNMSVSYIGR